MNCRKCKAEIASESIYCMYCGTKQIVAHPNSVKKRGNGQGTIYRLPNGKYKVEVVLGYYKDAKGKLQKKRVTKTFDKKTDALLSIPALKAKQINIKPETMTLHALYDVYTASKDYNELSTSQSNKLKYAWQRLEPIEFRDIKSLTVDDLQNVIDGAVSTYYPARDMKVMLSHLYIVAIKKEIVQYNKTDYIELPESPTAKKERWTNDELATFWTDYETHEFTGYILIMSYAGLRYGEMSTIQIPDVDLEKKVIIGGIKTPAGIDREIPIADKILPIVTRFYNRGKYKLLEMNEDNFYDTYWTTIERLGVRQLPPQTCRHTYFSLLTAAGVQAGIITETGGHASYLTTIKNYIRLTLEEKLNAVNQI